MTVDCTKSSLRNEYPPGQFLTLAKANFPPAGPDEEPRTVEINAAPWGRYRVTFVVRRNPRQGMRHWFWVMASGKRLDGH